MISTMIDRLTSGVFWNDAIERAFFTAGQAILPLAGVAPEQLDWVSVAGVGLAAALASVVWSILSIPGPSANLPWWQAVLYRAGKTFLVTLAGFLAVDQVNVFTLSWREALVAAGLAAFIAGVKSTVTKPVEVAPV